MAWAVKRSTLPYVARLGPIARVIVDFLLTVTPAPPPICAGAMERRRRLETIKKERIKRIKHELDEQTDNFLDYKWKQESKQA